MVVELLVELPQYICFKFNFVQYFYQCFCIYHKLVVLFDTVEIATCYSLRELFGDPWTKTPQYVLCQIEVPFNCSTGIFSDRDTLELQAASISFVDLLLRFTFTWFCFICGTVPLVFVFDYRILIMIFSSGWMSHSFHVWSLSIFKWNCPT